MNLKFLTFLAALCLLTACNDAPLVHEEAQAPPAATTPNAHAISMEQALANLDAFLTDGNASRSNHRTVTNVKTVKYAATRSRAEADAVDCDNLLYVANFADNQGYAILAADDRIPEPVLALVDSGNLNNLPVHDADDMFLNRLKDPNYPATGAGIFMEEGELLLNPNTLNLHTSHPTDTLIGNYDDSNFGDLTLGSDSLLRDSLDVSIMPDLCAQYAANSIRINRLPAGGGNDDDWLGAESFRWFRQDDNPFDVGGGGNSGNDEPNPNRTEIYVSDWMDTNVKAPLLSKYWFWHQKKPFNNYNPEVRKLIILGKKRKAPVGCALIAIGKVLAHYQQPRYIYYNHQLIDWNAVTSAQISDYGKDNVAKLMRALTIETRSLCFYQGTFTFPNEINNCLQRYGFNDVKRVQYNYTDVRKMLDDNKPVIIMGMPGIKFWEAHCWIVDGYKMKIRYTKRIKFINNIPQSPTYTNESYKMVHCDFGWGGLENGFYVDGIFKYNYRDTEYDYFQTEHEKINYTTYLRIVTYNN